MKKILHIVGARPQFMKLLPLYIEMKKQKLDQEILHTGQHFDESMSKVFFDQLGIPSPNFYLNINNLSHGAMTGRMIEKIEQIIISNEYDLVVVYGDTNSTLAGSISAKKLDIKLVHIESGVRNHDSSMPEEINRVLSDRISDILFCNSQKSFDNLISEGYDKLESTIVISGDLMLDCLKMFEPKFINPNVEDKYILVTCHRASNTKKDVLEKIIHALNNLAENYKIIFPVHPRTKSVIDNMGITTKFEIQKPRDYLSFMGLVKYSDYIITDSGGLIREAYWLKKKSLLILENPLWPELIEAGACISCCPETNLIIDSFKDLEGMNMQFNDNILGEGNAAEIITQHILSNE
tara:strand:+ start:548 stop:1600 length:1053 start_codon:yes stop_codon:yes gene_type:complete